MDKKYAKTPTIYQMEATECGAVSLLMILAYYGCYVSIEKMRIETGVSRDGCNAKNICMAAEKYGMTVHGFRKSLDNLQKAKLPCIIHWNFNHFVVYEGKKGDHYYINDPAIGRRKLSYEEMNGAFTGITLEMTPNETFVSSKRKNTLLEFIKQRLDGQYSSLAALLMIGLLLVFSGMLIPALSQIFVDEILLGGNTEWFSMFLLILAGTVLFQVFFSWYQGILLLKLQGKMAMITAHQFLSHMFRLPMNFFDQRYAGDLVDRVDNNSRVNEFLTGDLAETVLNVCVAAFFLVLMIVYSPFLTLIALICVSFNIILATWSSKLIENKTMKLQQDQGKLVGALCAGMNIIETIKASGGEQTYIGRTLGFYAKTMNLEQKVGKTEQLVVAVPETLSRIAQILVLLFGSLQVMEGKMTAGMLLAYGSLLSAFTSPVNRLVSFIQQIQKLKADMSRVEDIQRYEQDEKFAESQTCILNEEKLSGDVEVCDVTFGYSKLEKPLIEHFHFVLNSGSMIAFVGASGCGKSTISKIISGLYQAWSGEVRMDNIPIRQIGEKVLASSVSVVTQEITIFSGSIRDNLTMWNRSIMEEDIVRAAKDACIHDIITKKPNAYDYHLSEGGRNLSGGQRQRLEIARALVTNPTILIMDEATSALDPLIEKEIIDNIKRRGCTCIIVAHRLSAIRDCSEIIVLNQGKVVERGTHEELMQQEGQYSKLVQNI